LLIKNTQNAMKKVYSFVPMQDFSKPWTDEELYQKYGLTQDEIAFIESMVRPMPAEDEPEPTEEADE
jgi:site-specific DNA-methyltransferase (adenine-specific)